MASKTASGLVAYCKAQLGKPYWMGTYGNTASEALYKAKKAQLPQYYTATDFSKQYGKRVHDCVGMIKGYRWSDTPTSTPKYVASQDVAVSGLYAQCSKKGSISSMPDVPGTCVFMDGHVGVYIGNGQVIEARGHAYGVVQTRLANRGWTRWGQPSWLTYDTTPGSGTNTDNNTEGKSVTITLKELARGSTGTAVTKLQIMLKGLGYDGGVVDSSFGPMTEAAVKAYQRAKGLTADGIAGAKTLTALYS